MIEIIIGATIGLCFFIVPLMAYIKGLNDGLKLHDKKHVEQIKNPVEVVKNTIENSKISKEEESQIKGLQNLLSYTGEPQKED